MPDYCTGLMMACERKSVEPLAAIPAPVVAAQHQLLLHFVAEGRWSDERVLARFVRWCCRRWSVTTRSKPGSSTTRALRSKAGIQ